MMIWKLMESDPLFHRPEVEPSTEEKKRRTALQLNRYMESKFPLIDLNKSPYKKRVSKTKL